MTSRHTVFVNLCLINVLDGNDTEEGSESGKEYKIEFELQLTQKGHRLRKITFIQKVSEIPFFN